MFYIQTRMHSAHFPSLIGTTSSELHVTCLKFYMSRSGKWSLQGKLLRDILCLACSKHQQSNLSPICLQRNSQKPGLHGFTSLYGYVSKVGGGDKHKPSFLVLLLTQGSLELMERFSPMCMNSGLGPSISTKAWLILERSKSHPSIPSFLTACCMDLMHQRLYTEASFSNDDSKVCKFSKVSSSDTEME